MLRFINSPTCLVLEERGVDIGLHPEPSDPVQPADLSYTTRWAYLRWALQRPYGDELLFVGSGGIFEYSSREAAARAIHRELIALIRNRPLQNRPVGTSRPGVVHQAKQIVKRLIGRNERDLYDLMGWTVFR